MNGEQMSELDLESGVSPVGSEAASAGIESILLERGQSLEVRSELEAVAEAEQNGNTDDTEVSTVRLGIDTVGGHDRGVQTDVTLIDDATRNLLLLLLQPAEEDHGGHVPVEGLRRGVGAAVPDVAQGVAGSARKPRSVPQDPRKFRSEASQEKERTRRNAKKAQKRREARLAEASFGDESPV